ncbi:Hypothetical_protein [Hexamita inflata]|uniref:Hypothetical_protein n=1 Tax=Hexamita inflata TaxID=28002 RepID=A0AA86QNA1_9EUKA|nr:Hypothetical protein HINF_LOCUS16075 [Hexamita inflata]CAI9954875.1 Hypothetical protein HINF_LOCUS42520 [Hexamita inflata]
MFAVLTLQKAYSYRFDSPYGTMISQISNDTNLLDVITCDNVVYQIAKDGSIWAKGAKRTLFGNKMQYEFVSKNVANAKQLFCYDDGTNPYSYGRWNCFFLFTM